MLQHPNFDPVAVSLGHWHIFGHDFAPAIHWYGLTYMVAFGLFVWLAGKRAQYAWFAREGWVRRDVEDLLFYGVLGVVIGGRLGYVIFYKPLYYWFTCYRNKRFCCGKCMRPHAFAHTSHRYNDIHIVIL